MNDMPSDRNTWINHNFLLATLPSLTIESYHQYKHFNDASEHHIGRYLNWKTVAGAVSDEGINGDIVEFGTWQGLGLLMMAQCFESTTTPRKFIGIDSFEGLPESSNGWTKGTFNDTSVNLTKNNIQELFPKNPNLSCDLIQGWFNDPRVSEELYKQVITPAIIHFDADLGSSTFQALTIIEPYLIGRSDPIYFLFDDWGIHPAEVPVAWNEWMSIAEEKYNLSAEEISNTVYTRNFRITFN